MKTLHIMAEGVMGSKLYGGSSARVSAAAFPGGAGGAAIVFSLFCLKPFDDDNEFPGRARE